MPGTPKLSIVRPVGDNEKISSEDQKLFWSGVGMLLYLPSIQGLILPMWLKSMNYGANQAVFHESHCIIEYILYTKTFGLKLEPLGKKKEPCEIVCDARDPISRTDISGFMLYVLGVLVSVMKSAENHDIIQLGSWVGNLVRDCKRDRVHDPTAEKHKNLNLASSPGKSWQCRSHGK